MIGSLHTLMSIFKKKEVSVASVETEEQKAYRLHREAITNLTNLRNLWLYLLSKQNTREKKKMFKRDFIASDKFSEDLIEDTIKYYKKLSREKE